MVSDDRLPADWYRRSFVQKLAYVAFEMRSGPRPSASHREWLHETAKDPRKLEVIVGAGKRFHKDTYAASEDPEALLATVGSDYDVAISEAALRYHTHERWADYGCQVFCCTESLAALLALTDATIGYDAIGWPYPAFMIEVPAGYLPTGAEFADKPVRILVHEHLRCQGHGPDPAYPEHRWLHLEVFVGDNTIARWSINKPVAELEEGILTQKLRSWQETDDGLNLTEVENEAPIRRVMDAALNFACNFALWLGDTGGMSARAASVPKRKRQHARSKEHWPTTWVIGRSVKLDRELREAAKEAALESSRRTRKGWRLKRQRIVSGHWKHQPYGPRNSLRKLIRVDPYLRGPEGDEAWTHPYNATGGKKE